MAGFQEPVIEAVRLSKSYRAGFRMKRVQALVDLNLQVERGEIFGFLGPNGAGKTTTIKILVGLTKPTQGFATVLGKPPRSHRVKSRVGFLPESPYFYEYLTATEFLTLAAQLSGVTRSEVRDRVRQVLKMVRMEQVARQRMRGFSRGMLQRIGIAQALIHDPELVILDEPMGGLDPIGRKEFRDIIVNLREQGKTVFFSTHILADVEMICDRVGIIVAGSMVQVGKLSDILGAEVESIEITLKGVTGKIRKALERIAQRSLVSGEMLMLTVRNDDEVEKVMAIAREGEARVTAIVPRTRTLEEFFMANVKRAAEGGR
ncbi:MAG: ABC transporter ATP-binding protein [bacterium]